MYGPRQTNWPQRASAPRTAHENKVYPFLTWMKNGNNCAKIKHTDYQLFSSPLPDPLPDWNKKNKQKSSIKPEINLTFPFLPNQNGKKEDVWRNKQMKTNNTELVVLLFVSMKTSSRTEIKANFVLIQLHQISLNLGSIKLTFVNSFCFSQAHLY